jgi:hypothetical protein
VAHFFLSKNGCFDFAFYIIREISNIIPVSIGNDKKRAKAIKTDLVFSCNFMIWILYCLIDKCKQLIDLKKHQF